MCILLLLLISVASMYAFDAFMFFIEEKSANVNIVASTPHNNRYMLSILTLSISHCFVNWILGENKNGRRNGCNHRLVKMLSCNFHGPIDWFMFICSLLFAFVLVFLFSILCEITSILTFNGIVGKNISITSAKMIQRNVFGWNGGRESKKYNEHGSNVRT